jgi:hypothetical protein
MTRTRRWFAQLLAVISISALGGLSARAQGGGEAIDLSRRGSSGLRDISGTWEGTFRLDSTWRLPERATARATPARLRFNPVGDASPTTTSPRSVHSGTFEIDFARFGFTLSTQDALGWSVGADSMRAVLNPTVDHGLVEARGMFRGDTIVGVWRYTADPGGAIGSFEIKKRQ